MRRLTRRQRIGAAILAVIALMFISLDFAGGSLRGARSGATGTLGSLYRGTDAVMGPARRFIQGIPNVASNRAEIARLRDDQDALRRDLAAASADAATIKQLDSLHLRANAANWRILPARVIATGPGAGFQWTVTLDVGRRDRVVAGQTVTDGFGLVGRVVAVYPMTSVVLLVADPTAGAGVRDTRSGELLLATGSGSHGIQASPLEDDVDVKVGDHLVTGPVGGTTFVHGIEVGTVSSVTTSSSGTVSVALRPTASQTSLDLVGIILDVRRAPARAPLAPETER